MPSNFLQSATDAVERAFCRALNGVDRYYSFWSSLGVPPSGINDRLKEYVCDEPGPPPPPSEFTGGQCAVDYRIFFRTQTPPLAPERERELAVRLGPISQTQFTSDGTTRIYFVNTGQGPTQMLDTPEQNDAEFLQNIAFVTRVERVDGLPDDCGDPPPEEIPYPPEGYTENITFVYIDASDQSVTVNGSVTFFVPVINASLDISPNIKVPIRLDLGGVEFSGDINLPDFNLEISPDGVRRKPGTDFSDDIDPDTSPDNPDTSDDETERTLLGVLVRSQKNGQTTTTEIFQPGAPTLYVPRLANVYFRVRMGDRLSWMGPYDVKLEDQFVAAPDEGIAIAGRVAAEPGWSSSGIEVYRSSQPEP